MKKILSMIAFGIASLSFAQGINCGVATTISTNGTLTVPAVNGTYYTGCPANGPTVAPLNGVWYKFVPTASGVVTISSNLTANDGVAKRNETRFSVYTGTCGGTLTCVGGNDDVSTTNYRSSGTVTVTSGTTYYLQWDSAWMDDPTAPQYNLGFDFSYSFTSCASLTALTSSNITTTQASLSWTAPSPAPASYDIEYGALGFTQGTGTMANTTTTTYTFPAQPAGSNIGFYVRSNCGTTQGSWLGPYVLYLVKNPPYANNFDNLNNIADGFVSGGTTAAPHWSLIQDGTTIYAQSPTIAYYSSNSTTAASSRQLYSRPLNLTAGATNTATFYSRVIPITTGGSTSPMTLKYYYNTSRSLTGATLIGTAATISSSTYGTQTASFSTPTTGTYYFIVSNESAVGTNSTAVFLDTFNLTSTALGTNEIKHSNAFTSIYPNPTKDILNIKSDSKINAVSVVDLTGRKVNVKLDGDKVDVKSLPAGTYLINIETKDGTSTEKFIKK